MFTTDREEYMQELATAARALFYEIATRVDDTVERGARFTIGKERDHCGYPLHLPKEDWEPYYAAYNGFSDLLHNFADERRTDVRITHVIETGSGFIHRVDDAMRVLRRIAIGNEEEEYLHKRIQLSRRNLFYSFNAFVTEATYSDQRSLIRYVPGENQLILTW